MSGGTVAAMTVGELAATVGAVAAVGGGISSAIQGSQQADAAKSAQQQAQANANKAATQADQAFNQANQKRPDTAALLSAVQQAGKSGQSGTMLTGPAGIDPNALSLGKNTLLGS